MSEFTQRSIDDYDATSTVKKRLLDNLDYFEITEENFKQSTLALDKGKIKATGQLVVMKKIKENTPQDQIDFLYQSIVNEYCIMCELSHPALIYPIGLYHPDDRSKVVLVLPYYEKGSLRNFYQNFSKEFNLVSQTNIILGIAAGMNYLHSHGISHRDLKPDNILIDDNFYPIICDYNISRDFESSVPMETFTGTFKYLSPEQASGDPYTEKVDVYSFGILVNEMLTKEVPYQGLGNFEICNMIKNGQLPRIVDITDHKVPKCFCSIIKKCLNKDPKERPKFKKIFNKIKGKYDEFNIDTSLIDQYKRILTDSSKFYYSNFKIPVPIIELKDTNQPFSDDSPGPINFNVLENIFSKAGDRPIFLVMVFGQYQSGKSTFLRTITGNAAFYQGRGTQSTTLGLMIDGPYFVSELINQINENVFSNIKNECLNLQIDNDPAVYFIDSQGIGDQTYETKYKPVLDKILSMFLSVSLIAITISDFNQKQVDMENTLRAIRRGQLSSSIQGSNVFFLVRNYDRSLDNLLSISKIESINEARNQFLKTWLIEHNIASDHYSHNSIVALPLGNCTNNYHIFLNTIYFSLYYILKNIKKSEIYFKSTYIQTLKNQSIGLFNPLYVNFANSILHFNDQNSKVPKNLEKGLDHCYACCTLLSEFFADFLIYASSDKDKNTETIFRELETFISVVLSIVLPYIIGDDDIKYFDFRQYIYEIYQDVNSYYKKNNANWKSYVKNQKSLLLTYILLFAATSTSIPAALKFLPVFGSPLFKGSYFSFLPTIYVLDFIWSSNLTNIRKYSIATIYPYLWAKKPRQISYSEFDIMKQQKKIVQDTKDLLIFYEQNKNDSKLLFQALTGIDIKPKNDTSKVFLFKNVDSKTVINRFRRYNKEKKTNLTKKVHILYLKEISQKELSHLENAQGSKTIYITSIIDDQNLSISPNNTQNLYVYYLSTKFDKLLPVVAKNSFKKTVYFLSQHFQTKFHNDATYLLIISNNLSLNPGPRCQASIKYGSRYILQDPALCITPEERESYLQ